MDFRRLSPILGAECFERVTFPLSDESAAEIRSALAQYGVLVLRNQAGLSNDEHLELARLFGELFTERSSRYATLNGSLTTVEHAKEETYGNAQEWHCDGIFADAPFAAIVLRLDEIPECGGDTVFCASGSLYASFSETFKTLLRQLTVRYSLLPQAAPRRYLPIAKSTPVDLPLVIMRNGVESLFFSPTGAQDIPQLARDEAQDLIRLLTQRVNLFEHQMRVRWTPGAVVVLDNRASCHAVSLDYFPAVRKVTRVVVRGNPLIAAGKPAPGCPILYVPTAKKAT